MSYVVIARRWRPQRFDEIIGQEHVSKTLSNAISNNRIAHSYIFTGPRGVGKTTSARILAKALNCEQGPTPTPCNACSSCKSITQGNSLDVLEIDGASNRGIDEIRNLRDNIRYTPTLGKYKIYIIDEVHMLTKEAFNALLKTLEEPPAHALFIFATTEIHKVPATILSRCQRFDFRRIPLKTIMTHLKMICDKDKIKIQEEALLQIAKKADGSMRDAQSILDQIISYSGDSVKFENVSQALGVIHQDIFFTLTEHIRKQDIKALILLAKEVFDSGYDLNEFMIGLEDHFRNLLVVSSTGSTDFLEVSENYLEKYKEVSKAFSENDLIGYLQTISETLQLVKSSQQPNLKFELGLIKLAKMPSVQQIEQILEKLDLLKKKAPQPSLNIPASSSSQNETSLQSGLTSEQVLKQWPKVLELIHEKKPTLIPILEKANPELVKALEVELDLGPVNSLQKELLKKNKRLITQSAQKIFQLDIIVHCIFEELNEEAVKINQEQQQQSKAEIMAKIRKEGGEVISRLIDDLDLELV